MEFGLVSVETALPTYVRCLIPVATLAAIVFIVSIFKSLSLIIAKRKGSIEARINKRNRALIVNLFMLGLVSVFLGITSFYFLSTANEIIREYVKDPESYAIAKQATKAQFQIYLYFGISSILLGITSIGLIRRSIK